MTDDRSGDQPVEGRCNARRTEAAGGGLCRQRAGHGTDHPGFGQCSRHGGATRNGHKHARNQAEYEADIEVAQHAQVAAEFGLWDRDVDHVETVAAELRRCAGMIDLCEHRLRQLDPNGFVWGITSVSTKRSRNDDDGADEGDAWLVERTVKEEANLNAWIRLWHLERDKALRAAEVAHRIGMDQRQIELAEQLGGQMAEVLRRIGEFYGLLERPDWAVAARLALVPGAQA